MHLLELRVKGTGYGLSSGPVSFFAWVGVSVTQFPAMSHWLFSHIKMGPES